SCCLLMPWGKLKLDRGRIAAILIFEGYRFKRFVTRGILTTLDDVSIHEGKLSRMLIKKAPDINSSEVTDEKTYLNRRLFIRGAVLAGSVAATGFIYRKLNAPMAVIEERPKIAGLV